MSSLVVKPRIRPMRVNVVRPARRSQLITVEEARRATNYPRPRRKRRSHQFRLSVIATAGILSLATGLPTPYADAANLKLWYRADLRTFSDSGVTPATTDNSNVQQWNDISGNNNHAVKEATHNPPRLRTSALNGRPIIEYLQTDSRDFTLPDVFTGLAAGEFFAVIKADADPQPNSIASQIWRLGNAGDSHYVYTDGHVYECFGSTTQKDLGNLTPDLSAGYHVYNCYSASGDWQAFLDGSSIFSTATNSVGWPVGAGGPRLGAGTNSGFTWSGRMAEFLFYQHKLSGGDRTTVTSALGARHGLF